MINQFQKNKKEINLPDTIYENTNLLIPYPIGVIGCYNDYGGIEKIQQLMLNNELVSLDLKIKNLDIEKNKLEDLYKKFQKLLK